MPRPCLTCRHPQSHAINVDLACGIPRLTVARRYGLSEPAVRRHFHEHLPEQMIFEDEDRRLEAARELTRLLLAATAEIRKDAERALRRRRRKAHLRAMRVLIPLLEIQRRALARDRS
jgi:AraC-like DNA-binding protein